MASENANFERFFVQTLHWKIDMSHQKMDQLIGFLSHLPLYEIAKKLRKMLKHTPTFKVLSAPLPWGYIFIIVNFIIVKNACVSHNNPFAGKRMGRHGYISLL